MTDPYLIIDSFAGGGGASTGIEAALGRSPDVAINHDAVALSMHEANHPDTVHLVNDIWGVDPMTVHPEKPVGLLWASPDCKHFSKAKGGAPKDRTIRDLAWVVIKWAQLRKPSVIILENVEEFQTWGPIYEDGQPIKELAGQTFDEWVKRLRKSGYKVEWRELRACDYGAPTIRKRLFVIARRDGEKIVWPKPTHGDPKSPAVKRGAREPWKPAASIIDWSLPCPSIFDTSEEIKEKHGLRAVRPLADATLRRVAHGVKRYVLDAAEPFLVNLTHGARLEDLGKPLMTVTGANRGEKAVVVPVMTRGQHGGGNRDGADPLQTVCASPKDTNALLVPTLMTMGFGEREGQQPRVPGIENPVRTITAGGIKSAVVSAFLAQHNGNGVIGRAAQEPLATVTTRGTQTQLVSAHMLHMKGSNRNDADAREPLNTICATGTHAAMVAAFMVKYYGAGIGAGVDEPLHSVTTRDRFGLVTVIISGVEYVIVDIGMRMLTPRELYRAQGFPDDYIIDRGYDGRTITKTQQIHKCGNSVSPPLAKALAGANCGFLNINTTSMNAA